MSDDPTHDAADPSQGSLLEVEPATAAGPVPAPGGGPVTECTPMAPAGGTPGPGGWAWAVDGGPFASGGEPRTTNQRMEVPP